MALFYNDIEATACEIRRKMKLESRPTKLINFKNMKVKSVVDRNPLGTRLLELMQTYS